MWRLMPGMPVALCSVHSKITWILLPFFAMILYDLLQHEVAVRFCFFHHGRDAVFRNGLDGLRRHFQGHPLIFFRNIETFLLKIGKKSSLGLIVRVRNVVTYLRSFSSYLTNSCHIRFVLKMYPPKKGLQISIKAT